MFNSKLSKKIMTVCVAAALVSSFAVSAYAATPSSTTPQTGVINPLKDSDWNEYEIAMQSLYDSFTMQEQKEVSDAYNDVQFAADYLTNAGFEDYAKVLQERAAFKAAEKIVNKNYSKDKIVKNIYSSVKQELDGIIKKVGNAKDYEVFDALMKKFEKLDEHPEIAGKAFGGELTDDEFNMLQDAYNKFLEFSVKFQTAFTDIGHEVSDLMDADVANSLDVKVETSAFKQTNPIIDKDATKVTIEDEDAVTTAQARYNKLSAPAKYDLAQYNDVLTAQKKKINELKEAARKAEEEAAASKVSDSDTQTPDDGRTSGGNTDTQGTGTAGTDTQGTDTAGTDTQGTDTQGTDTQGATDAKGEDSVTDIETGEGSFVIPSITSLLTSALGCASVVLKKKKSM